MKAGQLKTHIYATYLTLRYGLAFIAVFFPMLLYVGGRFYGIAPQNSMSAYYFAAAEEGMEPAMRVWFIGLLFAIGTCMILYRGFSNKENILLNLAGFFAVAVALFPMHWGCGDDCAIITAHGFFAVLLFLCIGIVCVTCGGETLHLLKDKLLRKRYALKYKIIGAMMIASPLSAFAVTSLLGEHHKIVFFIEAAGIWAFAYYWWTKSRELAQSDAELLALHGDFEY